VGGIARVSAWSLEATRAGAVPDELQGPVDSGATEDAAMQLTVVQEDGTYKCAKCGHLMHVKKGQLLPPCTRCGGTMEKYEGPEPEEPACEYGAHTR
jgi:hypothetical protein